MGAAEIKRAETKLRSYPINHPTENILSAVKAGLILAQVQNGRKPDGRFF